MLARRRLPGRSPDLRSPRWYWTISVSSALWLQPAHRLLAFGGGGQHRVREPGQVGAHGDRLGGVESVLQATAGNQRQLGGGAVGRDQRLRRRDAPLRKGEGQLDFLGPFPAKRLDSG